MARPDSEQWLFVVGSKGSHQVSNRGRVKSLDRTIEYIDGRSGKVCTRLSKGRILKPATYDSGHLHVVINGITRTVHSLVAEAFIGPCPAGLETRHINGDAGDCHVENLKYGTRSENAEDSKRHGTHFHAGITECIRGHDLTDPANLQNSPNKARRTCLACRRERQALYNAGARVTAEGYCINGHAMIPKNRYTNGSHSTRCKPCALGREGAA